jgi:hypothetical protein
VTRRPVVAVLAFALSLVFASSAGAGTIRGQYIVVLKDGVAEKRRFERYFARFRAVFIPVACGVFRYLPVVTRPIRASAVRSRRRRGAFGAGPSGKTS